MFTREIPQPHIVNMRIHKFQWWRKSFKIESIEIADRCYTYKHLKLLLSYCNSNNKTENIERVDAIFHINFFLLFRIFVDPIFLSFLFFFINLQSIVINNPGIVMANTRKKEENRIENLIKKAFHFLFSMLLRITLKGICKYLLIQYFLKFTSLPFNGSYIFSWQSFSSIKLLFHLFFFI